MNVWLRKGGIDKTADKADAILAFVGIMALHGAAIAADKTTVYAKFTEDQQAYEAINAFHHRFPYSLIGRGHD